MKLSLILVLSLFSLSLTEVIDTPQFIIDSSYKVTLNSGNLTNYNPVSMWTNSHNKLTFI